MNEFFDLICKGTLEKGICPEYVCPDKYRAVFNRTVHVAFGCKMDNLIYFFHNFIYNRRVADVAFDKRVVRVVFKVFEVGGVSRIGQFVKVYDLIVRIFFQHITDKVAAYESAAACYKQFQLSHLFVGYR